MEIICDTNVWYKLGAKEINIQDFKGHKLIATILNIDELGSSENLLEFEKSVEVKKACKAIFSYANHIEMLSPFDFIYFKSGNTLNHLDQNLSQKIGDKIESLRVFSELNNNIIEEKLKSIDFIESIKSWDIPLEEFTRYGNTVLEDVRRQIKENSNKHNHRRFDPSEINKKFYEFWIKRHITKGANFSINWDDFKLILFGTNVFFKELEVSKMKIKKNDWIDLFNLAYVNKERKYLTYDNKGVNKLIKEDNKSKSMLINIQ